MTIPSFADAPPLRTDADQLERVRALIGPASAEHQIWLLLIDGDGRQLPTILPVSGLPPVPDRRLLRSLERLLTGLRRDLATDAGPGSVLFVLERTGPETVRPGDLEWSDALRVACARAGVDAAGLFLSSDAGVSRLATDTS